MLEFAFMRKALILGFLLSIMIPIIVSLIMILGLGIFNVPIVNTLLMSLGGIKL